MEVARVEWVKNHLSGNQHPQTFFSLDARAERAYQTFYTSHNELRQRPRPLPADERVTLEREVSTCFVDIIKPYMDSQGLEIARCGAGAGYSEERAIIVDTPTYIVVEEQEKKIGFQVQYWFSGATPELACHASFRYYFSPVQQADDKRYVLNDLFDKVFPFSNQDGIQKPILKRYGEFLDVASTDFVAAFISLVGDLLPKIGMETLEELGMIRSESLRGNKEYKNDALRMEILREAYEKRLESVLEATTTPSPPTTSSKPIVLN